MGKGSGTTRIGSDKAHPNNPNKILGSERIKFMEDAMALEGYEAGYLPETLKSQRAKILEMDKANHYLEEFDLSGKQIEAFDSYIGGNGYDINRKLRYGKLLTIDEERLVNVMLATMQKNKLPKATIVYRASFIEESGNSKAFVSTSTYLTHVVNGEFNTTHVHAYLLPKGTPYFYSNMNHEHEVILPIGFNLKKYKIK